MSWNHTNEPPWKAIEIDGFWKVTTDRGDPSEEYDVNSSGDEEVVRLQAAAPDLLAACEVTRRWIEDETLNDLDELSEDCKDVLATVRSAITAAKGEP